MVKHVNPDNEEAAPRRVLRIGSDFSGLDTAVIALRKLVKKVPRLTVHHTHSCDNNRTCRKIITHNCKPEVFYNNIEKRDCSLVPSCDIYTFTAPCQPFSTAGKGMGVLDPRGLVMFKALEFIAAKKPVAVLSENVPTLMTRHRHVLRFLEAFMAEQGYTVFSKILATNDFGIPQVRKRWYMMAILSSQCRCSSRTGSIDLWPKPLATAIPLSTLITPARPSEWRALPETEPARSHVVKAFAKAVAKGVNPFITPVVVDIGASPGWTTMQINKCPTITHGRAATNGYWVSTKGARIDTDELAMLQGFDPCDVDWQGAAASRSAYAGCLGNAQSLNVVTAVLPHLMFFAKLISTEEFHAMLS